MPKILSEMPKPAPEGEHKLRVPQIRVLQVLAAGGCLTRAKISAACGNKTNVVVGRAIGYSDPAKRLAFEQTKDGGGAPGSPCPSLLTLGYVAEFELDIDGVTEVAVEITRAGREALETLGPVDLPPLRE